MTAAREERRPREENATLVRLAPDGKRLAFAIRGAGIFVAADEGAAACWDEVDEPWSVEEIAWSPAGTHLAWTVRRADPTGVVSEVRWSDASGTQQPRAVPGNAFAWTPQGRSLVVADSLGAALTRQPVVRPDGTASDEAPEPLATLRDDGHPRFPPGIAISLDGKRLAWSCRRIDDRLCEVWVLARGAAGPTLLTQIPGSQVQVGPFWSPGGNTLGLHVVHLELDRSALIVVPHLEGEGVILHASELVDGHPAAAWSPAGDAIVFQRAEAADAIRLVALVPTTKAVVPLGRPGELVGGPRFLPDGQLVVDGGTVAHVLGRVVVA